jgi:ABC-type multidrug transport system fused ATPase/permease subunit
MTSATRMLRPYVRKEWRTLSQAGLLAVVVALADLARPWPLKLVLDYVILGHEGSFALGQREVLILAAIGAFVLAIALVSATAENASNLWLQRAGERISHHMRVAVYEQLQRLSLRFHEQRQKGDLVTRVTGDANAVGDMFSGSLGSVVQAAVLLLGMLAVTFVLDPLLALVWLAVVPFLAIVAVTFRARIRAAARRQRAEEGAIASVANEALSAMAVVKAFGSEAFELGRIQERSEKRMHLGIEASRLQAHFNGLVGVLSAFGTAAVLVLGVFRVAAGAITPGDLVVFVSYAKKADSPLRHIAREVVKISRSMARAERIAEIMAADELLDQRAGGYAGDRASGEIVFERSSFAYDASRPALRDVSLRVPAGSRVAVIGASGAGKSTLAALVARLYDPSEGRVLVDGRDLRDCSLAWLRDQVGVLLQDTVLFTGSVAENIAYGADVAPQAIVAAAEAAAAHDFVSGLPEGYATELGPQGAGLSGGQRQRIGIARTLLRDPPILLLDEPTTGLDAEAESQLLESLERLMRGRTTILVTHSLELARRADRVLVLDAGRIVAEGPPEELLAEGVPDPRSLRRRNAAHAQPPKPRDAALPQLDRLLEAEAMLPVLARSLSRETAIEELRIARVLYKPHRRIAVHFRALVDERRHDAVARATADGELEAELPRYLEAARKVNGRAPAYPPVAYDNELGAVVSWLPFDATLPALLESPGSLARRLRDAGLSLPGGAEEPHMLGYKPGARVVLRLGDHVVKGYGKDTQFRQALSGLTTSASLGAVGTARYEACFPELRLTVQAAVDGAVPETAAAAAEEAGAVARALQHVAAGPLTESGPETLLAAATRRAALLRAIVPELEGRIEALVARLRTTAPTAQPLVPAHGDFHVDQLLSVAGRLVVIDFDGMCLAPAALDVATYLADVVRGRGADLEAIEQVRAPLLRGYGGCPPALAWHLAALVLTRAPHPFNRFVPAWPERVEGMVRTAEEVLAA